MDDLFGDSNLANANSKDDAGDQIVIDLIPIPSESQLPDTSPDSLDNLFG